MTPDDCMIFAPQPYVRRYSDVVVISEEFYKILCTEYNQKAEIDQAIADGSMEVH